MISYSFEMKWVLGTDTIITTTITFILSLLCSVCYGMIFYSFEMKCDISTDTITNTTTIITSILSLLYRLCSGMISYSFEMKWDLGTDTITITINFIVCLLYEKWSGRLALIFRCRAFSDLNRSFMTWHTSPASITAEFGL